MGRSMRDRSLVEMELEACAFDAVELNAPGRIDAKTGGRVLLLNGHGHFDRLQRVVAFIPR